MFGPDWLERHREIFAVAPLDTVVIGDAGHLVLAEQPDATLAALSGFLDTHSGQ